MTNQPKNRNVSITEIRISSVTFDKKGKATIKPFTDYLPLDEAMDYLNGMGA